MRKRMRVLGMIVLAAGLFLVPAPSMIDLPAESGGPCRSLGLGGSVTQAGDPLNPDVYTGTLDMGALSCSGMPRNC